MLEVKDLYCERDDRVLFQHLDFSLSKGQAIQVQGSNGSGKTTLLRILCGLNADFTGDISWDSKPVKTVMSEFRDKVFYLGHAPAINKTLSPVENLRWFCASRGAGEEKDIPTALAAFGLEGYEDIPCYMMSAGQQRRVSLARMKLVETRLWVLDEPFTALDKRGVGELEAMLADFVDEGGALLLTTHHSLQMRCHVDAVDLDRYNSEADRS
jgi:heme exporter protein A